MGMNQKVFYVASFANTPHDGINILKYVEGKVQLIDSKALGQIRYIILSPQHKCLYAAIRESSRFSGDGEVAAFAIADDGSLNYLNSLPAGGRWTCHLHIHNNFLYCANYFDGTFAAFQLNNDGSFLERTRLINITAGKAGIDSHPHCVRVTPDMRFLSIVDLGLDRIFFYPLNHDTGIDLKMSYSYELLPGSGPRHIVFNHTASVAYVNYQLTHRVAVFSYADGQLFYRQHFSTLPEIPHGYSANAAIRMSPDGKLLMVSNRGHNSLARFDINPDGTLIPTGFIPTGRMAWDFAFLPKSDCVAVSCAGDDRLLLQDFILEKQDVQTEIELQSPVCIAISGDQ